MNARILHSLTWTVCFLLAAGCAKFGPGEVGAPCPVAWVDAGSIEPAAGTLRSRMHLRIGDEVVHLELITEPRADELVVVALARFGVRLFAVRQRGREVSIEGASTPELEQVAVWAMDALHRTYWIPVPSHDDDPNATKWTWSDETVSEIDTGSGRRREFSLSTPVRSSKRTLTSTVTIDYPHPSLESGTVEIRNPWCGYEAVIAPIRSPSR